MIPQLQATLICLFSDNNHARQKLISRLHEVIRFTLPKWLWTVCPKGKKNRRQLGEKSDIKKHPQVLATVEDQTHSATYYGKQMCLTQFAISTVEFASYHFSRPKC